MSEPRAPCGRKGGMRTCIQYPIESFLRTTPRASLQGGAAGREQSRRVDWRGAGVDGARFARSFVQCSLLNVHQLCHTGLVRVRVVCVCVGQFVAFFVRKYVRTSICTGTLQRRRVPHPQTGADLRRGDVKVHQGGTTLIL
jgi:hypothetical protein